MFLCTVLVGVCLFMGLTFTVAFSCSVSYILQLSGSGLFTPSADCASVFHLEDAPVDAYPLEELVYFF